MESLPSRGQTRAELIESFFASLNELAAEPHLLGNEADAIAVLRGILLKERCKSVVAAGVPLRFREIVTKAASGMDATWVDDLSGAGAKGVLAAADAGVTWATHGIALEGALIEVAYDNAVKLASSLPLAHIAILESGSILPDLSAGMLEVGRVIRESPRGKKPVVSFISGPSKTGDIEMRLLYGVHGPHSLYVLVLDWS